MYICEAIHICEAIKHVIGLEFGDRVREKRRGEREAATRIKMCHTTHS